MSEEALHPCGCQSAYIHDHGCTKYAACAVISEHQRQRELYREDSGDPAGSYYENSVFVTESGGIGMNVGGTVIVQPIADWHEQARRATTAPVAAAIDLWHRPKPGPGYWDFRCLRCSERVDAHPSWIARLRRRWSR